MVETLLAHIVESVSTQFVHGLRALVLAGPAIGAIVLIGARGLTSTGRGLFAVVLMATVFPALAVNEPPTTPALSLVRLATSGLMAAVAVGSALAAAQMAGAVVLETVTGRFRPSRFGGRPEPPRALGGLLNIAALLGFLHLGGPSSLTRTLLASTHWFSTGSATRPVATGFMELARPLVESVSVAVAVAAPMLAARLLACAFEGLWLRATRPAAGDPALRGLLDLAHLVLLALLLERMLERLLGHLATAI